LPKALLVAWLDVETSVRETCYRHPSRETGVHCSSCGRPICPDCMTPTPVGMRCPECARQRTKMHSARTLSTPNVSATTALIAINVIVFIVEAVMSGGLARFATVSDSIFIHGALYAPSIATSHEYWRLLTAGFLHASILHLLFNMVSLYFLGVMLEPAIGRRWFVGIYGVSLLAGSLGALIAAPNTPTIGASGAVFGVAGAALIVMRARGISAWQTGLPLFLAINLVIGFQTAGISIGGHIGGLIGGMAAATVVVDLAERRRSELLAAAGLVALAAAAAVGAVIAAHAGMPPGS
jgi:membrane associated rhomboid family serine protease